MNHIKKFVAALGLTLTLPMSAFAGQLPSYYPDGFSKTGTIDRVDTHKNVIVIDDTLKLLSSSVRVHTLRSSSGTTRDLEKGKKIGFTDHETSNVNKSVTEIWILPD